MGKRRTVKADTSVNTIESSIIASTAKRHIEVISPTNDEAYSLATTICQELTEQRGTAFNDAEVVAGLAEFLELSGRIQAKHLSAEKNI